MKFMPKDIILFGSIWEYSIAYFFDQIKEALEEDASAELVIRMNTDGGSPDFGMTAIQKVQELADQISFKVINAHSMGLFMLMFVDKAQVVVCDFTQAVLHRAAYPSWVESSSNFPGSIYQDIITKTNKDMEKAFRARVDIEALEALPQMVKANLTVKDIFSLESRKEVLLSGADLKKIGLAGRVEKMTPTKAEATMQITEFKKCRSLEDFKMAAQTFKLAAEKPEIQKPKNMTLQELKAENPALYQEIYNLGMTAGLTDGIKKEKDRVEACLVFQDIDPAGVKAAIESGEAMSAKQMAEFSLKATNAALLARVKKDSPDEVETTLPDGKEKTENDKKVEGFEAKVKANMKIAVSPAAKAAGF